MLKEKRFLLEKRLLFVMVLCLSMVLSFLPLKAEENDFTIVVLPDTQWYPCEISDILFSQVNWIKNNRCLENIVYVAQVGDLVQCGNTIQDGGCPDHTPDWCTGNWPNPGEPYIDDPDREWKISRDAFAVLENVSIPYGIAIGNHDQEPHWNAIPDSTTASYNEYFGKNHFLNLPYFCQNHYGGHYNDDVPGYNQYDNHYDLFSVGGMNFIVIYLEQWRIADTPTYDYLDVLDWADGVLKANPGRKAIIVHHFMIDNRDINNGCPSVTHLDPKWNASGYNIYDNLKDNPNLFLIVSGHAGDWDMGGGQTCPAEAHRSDPTYYMNEYGQLVEAGEVHTVMANYQDSLEGYLRIMKFSPTQDKIFVKTYSPYLNSWQTDEDSQFNLDFASAVNPEIRITSPNGGEKWLLGSTKDIAWNAIGITGNLKITLWKNEVLVGTIADNISPTTCSYTWAVGQYIGGTAQAGTGYKIKVREKTTTVSDMSDEAFEITLVDLDVLSPNGGESWQYGSVHNITWSAPGVTVKLKITLLLNGATVGIIADNVTPTTGSYTWIVGAGMMGVSPGPGYKVKIEAKGTSLWDTSDSDFTITSL